MESKKSNWNLYSEKDNKFLPPLKFSNGKTQETIVEEVLSEIKKGTKIIFIKGLCGTGKSAIALNIANQLGKSSIIVPIKNLQKQYELDYTSKKYLLKDKNKLKISSIKGRQNYYCPFLKEKSVYPKKQKKEINLSLDIFDSKIEKNEEISKKEDLSCDNDFLPCKIKFNPKNNQIIREYLRKNSRKNSSILSFDNLKRFSIAPVCPYWSPIIPSEIDLKRILNDSQIITYEGLKNKKYNIYQRKKGCGYYNQFLSYIDSDVLIFNSSKYKLELSMDRKPKTEIEIIDECDEFLDSFLNSEKIYLKKLELDLSYIYTEEKSIKKSIEDIKDLIKEILEDFKNKEFNLKNEIIPLKKTKIYELLKIFLDSSFLDFIECDDENYCFYIEKIAKTFENFFEDTYVNLYKSENSLIVELITINLEKKFQEILDKTKSLVLMSGTLHSKEILENIFGIKDFVFIEAETKFPGNIIPFKTGLEINCNYKNLNSNEIVRETYLRALNKCVDNAKTPCMISVTSFYDLPSELEQKKFELSLMSREKLKEIQDNDKENKLIESFKKGKIDYFYTTKSSRGVDFPGEICNSIIMTKYPYPNVNSIFWKILRQIKPEFYNLFYKNKSEREFLQRIYRALRYKDDKVYILSPDSRVFYNLDNLMKKI
jgi:Rad3-related DNA helicase